LNRLRITVVCTAAVQLVVALMWFGLIAANPNPRRGTVVNLVALVVAAMLALRAQHRGAMRRTTVTLNWLLAALWTWGLMAVTVRLGSDPDLARSATTIVVSTLAIIVPCIVNGIAVALLPRRVD
jgi:hypothetical protein